MSCMQCIQHMNDYDMTLSWLDNTQVINMVHMAFHARNINVDIVASNIDHSMIYPNQITTSQNSEDTLGGDQPLLQQFESQKFCYHIVSPLNCCAAHLMHEQMTDKGLDDNAFRKPISILIYNTVTTKTARLIDNTFCYSLNSK